MFFKVENEFLFSKIETGAWFCFSNLLDSNPKPKGHGRRKPKNLVQKQAIETWNSLCFPIISKIQRDEITCLNRRIRQTSSLSYKPCFILKLQSV